MTLRLTLPWPPRELSPNMRQHWSRLAQAKRRYRAACHLVALSQGAQRMHAERLAVRMRFVPPDRRARDLDNLIASMKAGLDGLADAIGVDDSRFTLAAELASGQVGGFVLVAVGEAL